MRHESFSQIISYIYIKYVHKHISRAKANRVLGRELINGHSKHPLSRTHEKTTHGHHQMENTEIRLIIFFAVKDEDALYSQQKHNWELQWKWKSLNFVTPWTIQSMEFSRPKYWSRFSHFQEIFPTHGLNPGFPHCRQILYQLCHKGSTRILEWVAYPFCRRSSWPRNQNGVSWIAGRFFKNWALR